MSILKTFRLNDNDIQRFNELKSKEKLTNDADFFRKMLDCIEVIQNKQLVPINIVSEKDEKLNKVFFELGRLQGVLKEKESILDIQEKAIKEKEEILHQKENRLIEKEISLKEKNDLIQKLENEKEKALTEKDELVNQKEQFIEQLKLERENIIKQKEQLEKEIINFENEIKNKSLFKRIFWAINLKK